MNKFEWAAVIADLIFGLLHTEDTLTLRVAGIMIDPFHPVPPLSFRMGFMLKHILISEDDPGLSRSLLTHVWRSCDVDPTNSDDKQLEEALVQLLYCDRHTAKDLVANTKKPVKISLKLNNSKPVAKPAARPAPQPSTSTAYRARRVIYKDDDDEPEEPQYTPTGRPRRGSRVIKAEVKDEDQDYKPTKKTRRAAAQVQPKVSPRGKYRKSQKQREKEMAAAKRAAADKKRLGMSRRNITIFRPPVAAPPSTSTFDPLDTTNADFDPLDPLAMNDEPSIASIDNVSIKTEVIDDDNPPTIQNDNSMDSVENPLADPVTITDDPVITDEPIEEDQVSNLLISSVTSVNNLDDLGMSSPAQSTSSLDIQADPLLENSAEENSIISDIPEQEVARQESGNGEVEVTNPQNNESNTEKDSEAETAQESQADENNENKSIPPEASVETAETLNEETTEQANEETDTMQEPHEDPMELDQENSTLQSEEALENKEPSEDPMDLDQENSNVLSEEANSMSTNGLANDDPLAAGAEENGIESDPFNQDSTTNFSNEDLESDINDLLQNNPLENGSSEEPTLLDDDDANYLLDQLVDLQAAGKSINENANNSESAASQ